MGHIDFSFVRLYCSGPHIDKVDVVNHLDLSGGKACGKQTA